MEKQGLAPHRSHNRLRDVEDQYYDKGHVLSFNGAMITSFDVCGSCEAHAILRHIQIENSQRSNASTLEDYILKIAQAPSLFQMNTKLFVGDLNFARCPTA